MGPIGSSKYTVYKSPYENMRSNNGLYATSPEDIPDGLIGADFEIFTTPRDNSLVDAGKGVPKLDFVQNSLNPSISDKAVARGSPALSMVGTASKTPGKPLFGPSTLTPGQRAGIGVAGMAVDAVGEIADAKKNLAVDEYLTDLNYWKEQGKFWFDKDANYAPTFDEYAPDMPSAVDALKEGSITGSNVADSAIGGTAKGALSGAAIGSVVPVVGTAVGAAVGAVAGGLVGLVTGIMSSDSAEKQDAKMRERTYNEYKAKLKTWTYSRNLKNQNDRIAKEDRLTSKSMAIAAGNERLKQEKSDRVSESKNTNKIRMLEILRNMGSSGDVAAQRRKTRWQ